MFIQMAKEQPVCLGCLCWLTLGCVYLLGLSIFLLGRMDPAPKSLRLASRYMGACSRVHSRAHICHVLHMQVASGVGIVGINTHIGINGALIAYWLQSFMKESTGRGDGDGE